MGNDIKDYLDRFPKDLPGILFILDEDLKLIDCNYGLETLTGIHIEKSGLISISDILPSEQKDDIVHILESAEGTKESSIKIPFLHINGTETSILTRFKVKDDGAQRYLICNGIDISVFRETLIDLEKSRREMEERYRQTLDGLMEGCHIIDFEWKYIYINEAGAVHARRNRNDFFGRKINDLFPNIDDTEFLAHIKRCMTERISDRMGADLEFPDGSHGQFEFTIHPVPEGVFILSQEISDRKAAEERSHEMEERLLSVVRHLPGIAYRCGNYPDRRMEFIGGGCFDLTGYAPEELIGNAVRSFGELILQEDRSALWLEIQKALQERKSFSAAYRILNRQGHVRWCLEQGQGVYDSAGSAVAVEGYIGDVTSLRMAEKEKLDTEEHYRILVENIGDILFQVDPYSNRILFISPSVERVLGYREQDVLGHSIGEFVHPDDLDDVLRQIESLPLKKQISSEYRIRGSSGDYRWFSAVSRMIQCPSKIDGCMVGTMSDITDRRNLEEQLRQTQRLESIGILAGGVAHDFNNYLAVVMMYGEFLTDKIPKDDPAYGPAREILEATKRSSGLTRQLLAFSRKQPYSPEIIDLNDLIRRLEKMLRRLIGEHITLQVELEENLDMLKADPLQLEQVIMNLVVNARDAMPEGGSVTITTMKGEQNSKNNAESKSFPKNCIVLKISDTGMGMDASVKAQIFEPFFTTKGRFSGTGLGLSVVYGIIKQIGGTIAVESEPNKGAEFTIVLPIVHDIQVPEKRKEIFRGKDESILLVEDEEALRAMVGDTLKSLGYRVTVADNPESALEMVGSNAIRPDLLITDVIMPEMDGRLLAEKVRERLPEVKTLLMFGYIYEEDLMNLSKNDSLKYLEKPFDTAALSHAVRMVLDGEDEENE